jgi:protein SCO1/2
MTRASVAAVGIAVALVAFGAPMWLGDEPASGRTAVAATAAPPAVPGSPAWAETADVVEHLGDRLPADLAFVDSRGQRVALGSLFDGTRPVLLVLAYYECPQLCSLVLDGAAHAMRALAGEGWELGRQYRAVAISFDATERTDQAARKQTSVLAGIGGGDPARWPFLVGGDASVRALTDGLGFRFLRDPATGALAHPAVAFVLTPDGTISRYLYGIDYRPRDVKLALLEASGGKTGSFADKVVLRCFRYDPATRRYGVFVSRFMELGGALILVTVLVMFGAFARVELRRTRERGQLP